MKNMKRNRFLLRPWENNTVNCYMCTLYKLQYNYSKIMLMLYVFK